MRRLVDETGDQRIRELFRLASDLHTNFYENWLDPDSVAKGVDEVAELVEKVEALRS